MLCIVLFTVRLAMAGGAASSKTLRAAGSSLRKVRQIRCPTMMITLESQRARDGFISVPSGL